MYPGLASNCYCPFITHRFAFTSGKGGSADKVEEGEESSKKRRFAVALRLESLLSDTEE